MNIRNFDYRVIEVWEQHEWNQMKKHNKDVEVCIPEVDTKSISPFNPGDTFFDGCTDAYELRYKSNHRGKRRYVDVYSLYPAVNFFGEH